jgi:hypothetical protein
MSAISININFDGGAPPTLRAVIVSRGVEIRIIINLSTIKNTGVIPHTHENTANRTRRITITNTSWTATLPNTNHETTLTHKDCWYNK